MHPAWKLAELETRNGRLTIPKPRDAAFFRIAALQKGSLLVRVQNGTDENQLFKRVKWQAVRCWAA